MENMKFIFASDIHGSLFYAKKILDKYKEHKAKKIILLGDILYHGPRNPLPKDYDPKNVAQLFNKNKDKIIAIRGNCDSEVDEMVLGIHNRSDYALLYLNGIEFFATHGHLCYTEDDENLNKGSAYIFGHIHLPIAKKNDRGVYILNPGSVSLPKENNPNSYGLLDGRIFKILTFDNEVIREIVIE